MIKSIENAENYKWGNNCDGWHLLKSDTLSVIQERMSPDTSEQLHYHNKSQQLFFILSGIAHFEIGEKSFVVKANQSIHIPAMIKHRISNINLEELHFLVISEPKSHGDRVNC
jgi:mannose-6-phosphate isomerase-like protein (cupin superfamily)